MGREQTISAILQEGLSNLGVRYKEKGVLTVLVGQELEGLLVVGKKGTVLRTDDLHRVYIIWDTCV